MSHNFINLPFYCLLFLLSGCSLFNGKVYKQEQKLEANRKVWSQKSSPNYMYELARHCFCQAGLFPATIVVRADTIHAVLNPETNDTLWIGENREPALEAYPNQYKTIPDLFDVIQNAINNDADQLDVRYNEALGYPVDINIDLIKGATDDEISYEINSLEL